MTSTISTPLSSPLTLNKKAPAFCVLNQAGETVTLKTYAGKWLVLYFYPKDNTPGCTTESIAFSKAQKAFEKRNAIVVGVSPDSPKSHCGFIDKQALTLELLSDPEHTMLEAYGVWTLKKLYGREYMGVERTTVLITPDGKVAHVWQKVKVDGHSDDVLAQLALIQQN